jgi:hypothetical protein
MQPRREAFAGLELAINPKAGKTLGLEVLAKLLALSNEMIE